jgi:RNA polymerase sigma factor (sigma-70 family)
MAGFVAVTPEERRLLTRAYLEGWTLAEMAAEAGVSAARICQRLTALRTKLQRDSA